MSPSSLQWPGSLSKYAPAILAASSLCSRYSPYLCEKETIRKEGLGCKRAGKILDNERVNGVLMDLAAVKQWGVFRTAEQCEAMLALLNQSVYEQQHLHNNLGCCVSLVGSLRSQRERKDEGATLPSTFSP